MIQFYTDDTQQSQPVDRFVIENPHDSENMLVVTSPRFEERGVLIIAVSDEKAVDSYNETFECCFAMTDEQAIRLRDYMIGRFPIAEGAVVSEWRPIENAPKDGTRVDLWMVDQDGTGWRITDAYYVRDYEDVIHEYGKDGSHQPRRIKRDGWFAPSQDYDRSEGFCDSPKQFNEHPLRRNWSWMLPTHWMFPPEPPLTLDQSSTE